MSTRKTRGLSPTAVRVQAIRVQATKFRFDRQVFAELRSPEFRSQSLNCGVCALGDLLGAQGVKRQNQAGPEGWNQGREQGGDAEG
jgi:hypothetical protein